MFSEKDYIVHVVGETNLLKARESIGWENEIAGYFQCINGKLTSLEGAPIEVGEEFSCTNNALSSLDFSPIRVGHNFLCYDNPILSIAGFGQRFVKDGYIKGNICIPTSITKGLMGLLLIPQLQSIEVIGILQHSTPFGRAVDCINAYLEAQPQKRDILTCQDELIDAGLKVFATI